MRKSGAGGYDEQRVEALRDVVMVTCVSGGVGGHAFERR
jgi:hypothetical protein